MRYVGRFVEKRRIILSIALCATSIALCASSVAWGQGNGRRGATSPAAPTAPGVPAPSEPSAAGRGEGRGAAAGAPAANEFFDFDPTATQSRLGPNVDGAPAETHQKITVNGQPFAYTTRVGFVPIVNATTGNPEAHIFFTSYSKDGDTDAATRPVMFFFGGAPGVSAAWQDFGGFGPKRMKAEGGWSENPDTILNQVDLVFVNPVGTGYSVPSVPSRGPAFWTTQGDISSLASFVRTYINRNGRVPSAIFLAGEDASTGRVAGLTQFLTDHLIPVRGIVLLSVAPPADALAGDTQYLTLFPTLVLSSWYHKKLSPDMNAMSAEQIVGQARQFASREYLHALYKGDRMTAEERTKAIADYARLTGLSKSFVANNELRITLDRYNAELMRDQHRTLAKSDSRVSGFTPSAGGGGRGGGGGGGGRGFGAPQPSVDFNMTAISGPFAAAYEAYLRRELSFAQVKDSIFYLSSGGIGTFTPTPTEDSSLVGAFARNPKLHLFIGIDYFDLGLPFYAAEYLLAHLDVAPEVRAHNITVSHQEAGQMAYLDNKALVKLEKELSGFVTRATATK
jgi:carboxypeptidase C (cathepsin A)